MAVHEGAAAEEEQEPDAGSTLLDTQVTEPDTLSHPSLIPAARAHQPINAFDALMASNGRPYVRDRHAGAGGRTTIDAQGFVDDQADESEEEDAFGIGGGHSDDEVEDGNGDGDGDGVVDGLVDDQEMTEAEKEADRRAVQEKHR
jgi:mediator of replication checkpoint protein 1